MKYLLAVGCSFTAGDGLPKRSIVPGSNEPSHTNDEAPFLVANKLGLHSISKADGKKPEYVNMSQSGGCNSFIRRKTINWLYVNKDIWKDIIVLVGWTNPFRDELFAANWNPENNDVRLSFLDQSNGYLQLGSKSPPESHIFMPTFLKEDRLIDNNFYKEYMVRHYSFDNQISITLDNILTLQNFLEVNNIKYVFWNSLCKRNSAYDDVDRRILWSDSDVFGWNKKRKFINHQKWIRSDIDFSWEEFLEDLDPPHGFKYKINKPLDDHPNELGHKLWADEIYKKIEELYGKEL